MNSQASNDDVPLVVYTAPQLQQSAFATLDSINDDSLVIEARRGFEWQSAGLSHFSNPRESQELLPQVKNMLIFYDFSSSDQHGSSDDGQGRAFSSRRSA